MAPKALLLDEPTANMDEGTERQILDTLEHQVGKETTLIVVTHKPSLLRLVDRIVVITSQGIAKDGPKEQVLKALKAPKKRSQEAVE
jgi:ATP-binding cassette subfamily C protein LapB